MAIGEKGSGTARKAPAKRAAAPRKRVPKVVAPGKAVPAGLGESGTALWVSVSADRELDAAARVLLLNACRIADRLDALDKNIGGSLTSYNNRGDEVINPLVSEHRQQYTTLSTVLGKLGLGELPKVQVGPSMWDELAKRRAERSTKEVSSGKDVAKES